MSFTLVLNQAAILFVLLIIGFVLKKKNIVTDVMEKDLANFIINVTLPALIITSLNYSFSREMFNNSIKLIVFGVGTYGIMILISIIFVKGLKIAQPQKGIYQFMLVFSNVGFMGYPIADAVYGEVGIFYAAIYNLIFNILLWTLGVIFANPDHDGKINLKMIFNIGTISVLIGFGLFLFSIKIPYIIYGALSSLGHSTTPLAMIIVGAMLGDAKIAEVFKNTKLLMMSVLRLIIIPIVIALVLKPFGLPEMISGIIVIISAMPAAANSAIFARIYNSDYRLASQGVFITTLLSVVSIPLMILVLFNM